MAREILDESTIPPENIERSIKHTKSEEELVDELVANQPKVINLLRSRGVNENIVEDVAQDAFAHAQKMISSFRGESSLFTWQCRIALNLYINFIRKRKNNVDLHREFNINDVNNSIDERWGLSVESTSPLEHIISEEGSKEDLDRLQAAIDKLPNKQKRVMLLHVEGKSNKEIADFLGIPEATVVSRIFYSKKKLLNILNSMS